MRDRHGVSHRAGTAFGVGIVEAALIGIDAPAVPEIIEIAERLPLHAHAHQLDHTTRERAFDQGTVKDLEIGCGERVPLTAPLP